MEVFLLGGSVLSVLFFALEQRHGLVTAAPMWRHPHV